MKVVAKALEVIAWFKEDGSIIPIKFRLKDEEENLKTVKIERIMKTEVEKLAGQLIDKFTCICIINNLEKICEIKYDRKTKKWILFKI